MSTTTPRQSRGAIARPALCGLLILVSALPFAVVGPRLKAEYDHMRRSEVSVAPVAVPVPPVAGHGAADGAKVVDGRRKELSR